MALQCSPVDPRLDVVRQFLLSRVPSVVRPERPELLHDLSASDRESPFRPPPTARLWPPIAVEGMRNGLAISRSGAIIARAAEVLDPDPAFLERIIEVTGGTGHIIGGGGRVPEPAALIRMLPVSVAERDLFITMTIVPPPVLIAPRREGRHRVPQRQGTAIVPSSWHARRLSCKDRKCRGCPEEPVQPPSIENPILNLTE